MSAADSTREAPVGAARPYRIVVGIDFDETGSNALREACRLAALAPRAEVHAVHVVPEQPGTAIRPKAMEREVEALGDAPLRLKKFIEEQSCARPDRSSWTIAVHARAGEPSTAIHQLAVDLDADMIVVGTHGRRGIKRLAFGSVAQRLVQNAHCPVLIARPKDFSSFEPSLGIEPPCPDCLEARRASEGQTLWCEFHSRRHVRLHGYGYSDSTGVGSHDPGLVPGD